ncbi:dimethylargininase [Ilumatobacter sp.]|uniref:dimethylargininase n=1 Tax=Ilumatobacter sp. TaxID=1967498 RepID=UPI00345CA8DE
MPASAPVQNQRRVIVRPPGHLLDEGELTHIPRLPVDVERAHRQWEAYVEAFRSAGWEVVEATALDEHPDAVFMEDNVFMYGTMAVIARPGAATRRDEVEGLGVHFARLGYDVASIEAPGTLEGGDVMKVGTTVYVGLSTRTNAEGVRQLREILAPRGANVVAVPVSHVLHLKSGITALPDGSFIAYPPLVDDASFFPRFRPAPEPTGSYVIDLGDDRVMMHASAPETVEVVRSLGYDPVVVDISEFEKMEACITCLSVRLRTAPEAA